MAAATSFQLMKSRQFAPFFWVQFLGACNDNLFKNALIMLINLQLISCSGINSAVLINICAALFILPFFLFSAVAGQLADKFDKAMLIRKLKAIEVVIVMLAGGAFYLHSLPLLWLVLLLLGGQSAVFGPLKYSIIPQHVARIDLVAANGLVEMGTFLAILLGTLLGGLLVSLPSWGWQSVTVILFGMASLGWLFSLAIPEAQPNEATLKIRLNPLTSLWQSLQCAYAQRTVFQAILGISWFWFYGAFFLTQLPSYISTDLHANAQVVTLFLVLFSLGIGLGSVLCKKLSGNVLELGLVPLGSIGLSLFAIDLYFSTPHVVVGGIQQSISSILNQAIYYRILIDFLLIGLFGGFYIVPLYTLVQYRGKQQQMARIIAANNILNSVFMVLAALLAVLLLACGMQIHTMFLLVALLNVLVALYIYLQVPEFLMRFLIWVMVSLLYRVKVESLENIPAKGAAVLVCNHISFIDALIITAYCRRPIRFVMYYKIFQIPILNFIFRTSKAIPIAKASEDPQIKQQAFIEVANALRAGELVAIFPEGGITYDGEVQDFRSGIEAIIQTTPVPVIPMALCGLWGSFFSREQPKISRRWYRIPRRILAKIALKVGTPILPEAVTLGGLRNQVIALRGVWK